MDQSSAAEALFEEAAGPGPRTRSQSRNRDSSLSTTPPSPAPPTAHRGTRRHVHFNVELETGPSSAPAAIPTRSTRGKAPVRLVDQQTLPESTQRRVTTKRPPSTELPQPPLKKGKERTSNTSKKTKIQALATKNRPAKLYNNLAPTTRRSTTTTNKVTKLRSNLPKGHKTAAAKKASSDSTAVTTSPVAIAPPVPISFKLQFDTRWGHQRISESDTSLADSNKPWAEALKEMDETVIPYLGGQGIALFYPWKIKALITSTGARGLRQTEAVVLARVEGGGERWKKAMDLVQFSARSGMKDLSLTVESIWTPDGKEPEPEAPPAYEAPTITPQSSQTCRNARSQRSIEQTTNFMSERAVFWHSIVEFWDCPTPLRCHIKLRRGLACFPYQGRHYEIVLAVSSRWRDEVRAGRGTLEQPNKAIRDPIKRFHWAKEAALEKQPQRRPNPAQGSPSQGTINNIYVGHEKTAQSPATTSTTSTPRQVSPVPPELNTSASWEDYWDGIKLAYPDRLTGLDRAKAGLEEDYWTLRMLYASSDDMLSRVIKQTGLRITLHEELTKFVDNYKRQQRRQQNSDQAAFNPRHSSNLSEFRGSVSRPSSVSGPGSTSSSSSDHEI
ncbi:hypothetical protein KCU78_g2804, partial [Aureobasidium melanogenum]